MNDYLDILSADIRVTVAVTAIVTALTVCVIDRLIWGPPSPPPPPGPPTKYRPQDESPTRPRDYIPMSYTYGGFRVLQWTNRFYVDLNDAGSFFEELRRYGMAGVAILPLGYDGWVTGPGRLFLVEHDAAQELLDIYRESNELPRIGSARRLAFIAVYPKGVKGAIFTTESPMLRAIVEPHPTWGEEVESSGQQPLDLDAHIMVETRSRTNGKGVPSALSEYVDERALRRNSRPNRQQPHAAQPLVEESAALSVSDRNTNISVTVELLPFDWTIIRCWYPRRVEVPYRPQHDSAWRADIEAAIYGEQVAVAPGSWAAKWRAIKAFCRLYQIYSTTAWSDPLPGYRGLAIEFDATLRPNLQVVESYCRRSVQVSVHVKMVPTVYLVLFVGVLVYIARTLLEL
ncbi:hypothetical protein Dda_2036 [Drechslerella dactyloides]|uniref:Uncharacterized protein n=1 Tax=Drechslerella dactyloides TaxID=74499 RepID=A0AAD6J701_DREDA|nr:hypothetical protein Dda_2036 [Drechslerella dactyloides]